MRSLMRPEGSQPRESTEVGAVPPDAEVDVYVDLTCEPALESRGPLFPTLHSMRVRVAQVLLEFGVPPGWAHVPSAHDLAALR